MKKIAIIGCGGSGKSTLSIQLGQLLQLPVIHLDEHFFEPNWKQPDMADWTRKNKVLVAKEEWVMDGNYGSTMVMRLKEADTIIYLAMPTRLCLYRILKRSLLNYGQTRQSMAADCKERFDWTFFKYVYNFRKNKHPGILKRLDKYCEGKEVVIIYSKKELKYYLKQVGV